MTRTAPRAGLAAGLLGLALAAAAQPPGEKLPRVEIGKRAKAATAFVDVPGRGTGTAFCVHPAGLFVTNEHVVRGAAGAVTVVLDPALPTQRVLKATVARTDAEADLALLRVEGATDLPALPLGTADGLAELADVVACGFPLGKALAPDRAEYPAVSVNAGTVTALRFKGKELHRVQVDVALTYGNSGGPVLDDRGRVVGVVVSGVGGGKGINLAIPAGALSRFLAAPDIAFTPPPLTTADLARPVAFTAKAAALVPGAPEPALKLVLRVGDEPVRTVAMAKAGGSWTATATPSARGVEKRVEVTARYADGSITGLAADAVFSVGGRPLRLGGVTRIEPGPAAKVTLADGKTTADGALAGLGAVKVELAGQALTFDLGKATLVTVRPAPAPAVVTATVVAEVGGKEVGRVEAAIPVRDPAGVAAADPSAVPIAPAAVADERTVRPLPEPYSDVVPGGGGRYLVFHLPRLRKLAVFDVSAARVTGYVPAPEDKIAFAAGLESVVVGLPKAGVLERWSLTTFEKQAAAPPPFRDEIKTVVMGHGSNGPVVVNGMFLDPATFRPLGITDGKGNDRPVPGRPFPSGDGSVYASWNSRYSPISSVAFVLEGSEVKQHEGGELKHVIPGPDGRAVFTAKGVVSRTLARAEKDDEDYGYCLPALRGDYFLALTPAADGRFGAKGGSKGGFTVYLRGVRLPVARLPDADHGLRFDGWDREDEGPWKRVFFVPDAKVIAVLPPGNDRVVLHKFDADAALAKSGLDYLMVTSRPPAAVAAGATFTYPVAAKSNKGGVTVRLDSGPPGLAVSAAGVVTWAVPADAAAGDRDVILTVRDAAGRETFHTFTVRVTR